MTETAPIRVALIDDQALFRTGLRMIVESTDDLVVCGEAANGREAVDLLRRTRADVALMDVRMPVLDGIAATAELRVAAPHVRVLVLTTYDEDDAAFAAIRAGAAGFLLKDGPAEDLLRAVRAVADGDAVLAPSTTRRLLEQVTLPGARQPSGLDRLTDRERQVLLELATGATNAEIATRVHLSATTVKTHVAHILAKLGLRDRIEAVILAYESGLVRPGGRQDLSQ